MNAEELKQLKKGDTILVRARFKAVLGDGDVLFSHSVKNAYDDVVGEDAYTHPQNIVLPSELKKPSPKYDPCRPFRVGDKVELRAISGRKNQKLNYNYKYKVVSDEDECGAVSVEWFNSRGMLCSTSVLFVWLELVTPVEELEPYSVGESTDYFSVDKDDAELCLYWKDKHPNPKAAAEAERDRLNAEHRKEEA